MFRSNSQRPTADPNAQDWGFVWTIESRARYRRTLRFRLPGCWIGSVSMLIFSRAHVYTTLGGQGRWVCEACDCRFFPVASALWCGRTCVLYHIHMGYVQIRNKDISTLMWVQPLADRSYVRGCNVLYSYTYRLFCTFGRTYADVWFTRHLLRITFSIVPSMNMKKKTEFFNRILQSLQQNFSSEASIFDNAHQCFVLTVSKNEIWTLTKSR